MSLELAFERLAFRRIDAQNSAQSVVEGTITLPSGAPEIGRALKLEATPNLSEVEVKDGKVIFEGTLDFQLLYVRFEERPVLPDERGEDEEADEAYDRVQEPEVVVEEVLEKATWKREVPFAFLLDLPGVAEGDAVETRVQVEGCSLDLRSDQVTLDVDAVLDFSARKERIESVLVATAARTQAVEAETRSVRVRNLLGSATATVEAGGELSLAGRAAPQNLLRIEADSEVTEAFVDEGKVRVKGYVNYSAFYVAADGSGPQYSHWPRGVAFETEVAVDGARRGAVADVKVAPGAPDARVVGTDEGRELSLRTPLTLAVTVYDTREVPMVTALSSERTEVAVRKEHISLLESVGEGSVTERADTTLELPEGLPGIERILYGEATATVDDVHVLGDKVAVEFHVDVELVYLGRAGKEGGVHIARWPKAIGMDVEIPLEGAEPGLERSVIVSVEAIQFDLINRESVDAQVIVAASAAVSREVELEAVVEAVEVPPAEAAPPTYTFVVTQPGDTVWKLAARYRVRPDVIARANDWVAGVEGELPTGRKVCVPRKAKPEPAA